MVGVTANPFWQAERKQVKLPDAKLSNKVGPHQVASDILRFARSDLALKHGSFGTNGSSDAQRLLHVAGDAHRAVEGDPSPQMVGQRAHLAVCRRNERKTR